VLLSAVFSSDGKRVLAASADGHALVWDADTGALVATLRGHVGLLGASFSQGGTQVLTASGDGAARVWQVATGRRLETFPVPSLPDGYPPFMWTASFSPGGSRIVSGSSDGTARIWDAVDPKSVRVLTRDGRGAITAAAYSPSGRQIAVADAGGTVTIWNAATRTLTTTLPPPTKSPAPLADAIFSSGGDSAVLASRFGSLTFWRRERPSGADERALWKQVNAVAIPEGDAIRSLAVGMHGAILATGAVSGRVWLWSMPSGQPDGELYISNEQINSVVFDPAKPRVILAASDDGCAYLADVTTGLPASRHNICTPDGYGMTAAAFSPNAKLIVTGDAGGSAQLWNANTQKPIAGSFYNGNARVNSIEFSANGRDVVVGSGSYGWVYTTAPPHTLLSAVGVTTSVAHDAVFSPDGTAIATASSDGLARIWDVASQQLLLPLAGHEGPVVSAAFSPGGQQLITASADGTAKVWDTAPIEQSELLPGTRYLITAAFDPRQPQFVATAGGSQLPHVLTVWNRDDPGRPVATLRLPSGPGGNTSAEFSQDGRYLVATGGNEEAEIYAVDAVLASGDRARPIAVLNASGSGSACSSRCRRR
jgi:WD40 repeat protein